MTKLPDFHGPHVGRLQADVELVEWSGLVSRFHRVRVLRHICQCKARVYEFCAAGGLAWVRRTDRLESGARVMESWPCSFGAAEELWENLLAGRAR